MLDQDLESLVRARPAALAAAIPIARHEARRPARWTWQLDFLDGVRLKGRVVASARAARGIEAIVARLDPARFPRVLARSGRALLEEWVHGEAPSVDDPAAVRWAGETLRAVHATPPPPGLRAPRDPARAFAEDLDWLLAAGALDAGQHARLARSPPPPSKPALVHRDLCPENLVRDGRGTLHAIDQGAARLGWPEEDLARTLYRWPMPTALEDVFLDAYGCAPAFCERRAAWTAAALAHAARVRLSRGYARAFEPVRLLVS